MLQGFPVEGLIRVHLCGPAWEFLASRAAEVIPLPDGTGDSVDRGDSDAVPDADAVSLAFC